MAKCKSCTKREKDYERLIQKMWALKQEASKLAEVLAFSTFEFDSKKANEAVVNWLKYLENKDV